MALNLFRILRPRWTARRKAAPRPALSGPRFRPGVESLESRLVLSSPGSLTAPGLGAGLFAPLQHQHHQAASMVPIRITGVSVQNGNLVAHGLIGVNPFSAPITLSTPSGASPAADPTCPILNLTLGPIHLDLLGLDVDTSPICLSITAQSGPGNLLGNLLCDVAHLLDNGLSLGQILGTLRPAQLGRLERGVTNLLNDVFRDLTAPSAVSGVTPAQAQGTTEILHLSLGPLDLNLLGLDVHLDDCSGGPVTLDISAVSGPGNLLGNLLTDLANLLNNGGNTGQLDQLLTNIADRILMLI